MKSFIQLEKDHDGVNFKGKVFWHEWPKLDHVDSALIQECGGTKMQAADWLLALEVIFRRMNEQYAAEDGGKKC